MRLRARRPYLDKWSRGERWRGESLGFWVCWAGSPQSVREKRGAPARCFEVIWGTPRSAWPALPQVRFTSKPLLSVSLARGERARKQDSKARTLVERHISFEILSMFHFPPHLIMKYPNTESKANKEQCPKPSFPKGQWLLESVRSMPWNYTTTLCLISGG